MKLYTLKGITYEVETCKRNGRIAHKRGWIYAHIGDRIVKEHDVKDAIPNAMPEDVFEEVGYKEVKPEKRTYRKHKKPGK